MRDYEVWALLCEALTYGAPDLRGVVALHFKKLFPATISDEFSEAEAVFKFPLIRLSS